MERRSVFAVAALFALSLAASGLAKDSGRSKPGPLTGTWECMSHGLPEGDMTFTLSREQNNQAVTGSVSSPLGSTDLMSATFKNKALEIHIDIPQANFLLHGTYKKGALAGEWSSDGGLKGTWEGKKSAKAESE